MKYDLNDVKPGMLFIDNDDGEIVMMIEVHLSGMLMCLVIRESSVWVDPVGAIVPRNIDYGPPWKRIA